MTVRPAKTQISLGLRPVWSESSLCTQWVVKDPSFLHMDSEDSDQIGRMPMLIGVFAVRRAHFVGFLMRWLKYVTLFLAQAHYESCYLQNTKVPILKIYPYSIKNVRVTTLNYHLLQIAKLPKIHFKPNIELKFVILQWNVLSTANKFKCFQWNNSVCTQLLSWIKFKTAHG